jgi:hypothetical protein
MASDAAELPSAVRKGPLITLTCKCGRRHELHYGERWRCEGCGRTWDTNKIPLEEYTAIRRRQIRYRLFPIISGLLLLAGTILFFATGRAYGALIVVPFLMASWNMFGRPVFRRKYRQAIAKDRPTWEIDPD